MPSRTRIFVLVLSVAVLPATTLGCKPPQVQHSARSLLQIYDHNLDNVRAYLPSLVTVPGMLGSQIIDSSDGRMYWGSVLGKTPTPTKDPQDARKLALPMVLGAPLSSLHDELEAGEVLLTIQVELPTGPIQVHGYPGVFLGLTEHLLANEVETNAKLVADPKALAESGWATPYRAFAYDWRRDLSSQLDGLDVQVRAAAADRHAAGVGERTDVIAHSMGTLLVRYYLRYGVQPLPEDGSLPELTWAGAEYVDKAILIAPPNTGSPTAFENLVNGKAVAAFLPTYPPALVGTFPGLYQLLPRTRHATVIWDDDQTPVDVYDSELWRRYNWGMFAEDQDEMLGWLLPQAETRAERLAIAADHLRKCLATAEQFARALDLPAAPPHHLAIHLFASDDHLTPSRYQVERATGEVTLLDQALGDGSVTRSSALADERQGDANPHGGRLTSPITWSSVHFGTGEHLGLTANIDFIDNLLYIVLESPRE